MKIYLQFYRLYYVWFTIGWIAGLWVYFAASSLVGALAVKASLYILLYFTSIFEVRKYWCYFQNNGHTITKLYIHTCLADFTVFAVVANTLNLIFYA